jgi:hypothetical protein
MAVPASPNAKANVTALRVVRSERTGRWISAGPTPMRDIWPAKPMTTFAIATNPNSVGVSSRAITAVYMIWNPAVARLPPVVQSMPFAVRRLSDGVKLPIIRMPDKERRIPLVWPLRCQHRAEVSAGGPGLGTCHVPTACTRSTSDRLRQPDEVR